MKKQLSDDRVKTINKRLDSMESKLALLLQTHVGHYNILIEILAIVESWHQPEVQ